MVVHRNPRTQTQGKDIQSHSPPTNKIPRASYVLCRCSATWPFSKYFKQNNNKYLELMWGGGAGEP